MTESLLPNKARQVSLFKPLATLETASMHIWLGSNSVGGDGGVVAGHRGGLTITPLDEMV